MSSTGCSSTPPDGRRAAPYGTWTSPITAARVSAGALRFADIQLDGDDVYWIEGRAAEGGRAVIVRRTPDGRIADVTPPDFNVRTRVYEYGGAPYLVDRGAVYFSNFDDQRLHRQRPGGAPEPLTRPGFFYSDCRMDRTRGRVIGVREDHSGAGEPVNTIVALDVGEAGHSGLSPRNSPPRGRAERIVVSGSDFYADPVISPDGSTLAWLEWRHPNMPWDGTELWMAPFARDGSLGRRVKVAGGADESIFQPEWSPDGRLYFVSDRTGWWNLYRQNGANIEAIHPMAAEFGKPQWTLSMVTYAFIGAKRIAATYAQDGRWKMALIETDPRKFEPVSLALEPLESIRADARAVYFIGGSPTSAPVIARMTLAAVEAETLRESASEPIDPRWISVPEALTFPSPSGSAGHAGTSGTPGTPGSRDVHAFYYAPHNPDFRAPDGERPPLLVITHGGPTSAHEDVLDPGIQFWTSRGFAVLDVNYSGSSGYGRAYRDRLKGQWGIADVDDVAAGARAMVEAGRADAARLIIRGGSAGGYTTLAALTFRDVFKAGASYYGVSDIEVLARDTHKFESRYLDSLIGPYPAARDRYRERSPIHFTDRLSCALILFQGLDDKVVPPNQSEMMADAVRRKGLPVAYITYEGEQHGFRRAENIVRSLEAELFFYGAVFGFAPADPIAAVAIDNLDAGERRPQEP
jgi:dipeptidyl aminopeptidase/acylaminoacyl peptidase